MKNLMIVSMYTNMQKGRAFFDVVSSLSPGSDIQIKPQKKNVENRQVVEISDATERGKALMTLVKEATAKSSDGVFISKETKMNRNDEEPSLADFDYEGHGLERPEVD